MTNWNSSSVQFGAGSTTLSYGQIRLCKHVVKMLAIEYDITHFEPMDWKHIVSGSKKAQSKGNSVGDITISALNLLNKFFYITLECNNSILWWL